MSPQTKQNLRTAMQNEAFTQAEYLRFAARARMNENWDLAQLFQIAAENDRTEHFAEEAQLACLVADDSENLRNAIDEKRAAESRAGSVDVTYIAQNVSLPAFSSLAGMQRKGLPADCIRTPTLSSANRSALW